MPWEYYDFAKGVYMMDNANGTWVSKSAGITFSNDFIMYPAMAWNDINTIYLGGNDNALGAPLVYRSRMAEQHGEKNSRQQIMQTSLPAGRDSRVIKTGDGVKHVLEFLSLHIIPESDVWKFQQRSS